MAAYMNMNPDEEDLQKKDVVQESTASTDNNNVANGAGTSTNTASQTPFSERKNVRRRRREDRMAMKQQKRDAKVMGNTVVAGAGLPTNPGTPENERIEPAYKTDSKGGFDFSSYISGGVDETGGVSTETAGAGGVTSGDNIVIQEEYKNTKPESFVENNRSDESEVDNDISDVDKSDAAGDGSGRISDLDQWIERESEKTRSSIEDDEKKARRSQRWKTLLQAAIGAGGIAAGALNGVDVDVSSTINSMNQGGKDFYDRMKENRANKWNQYYKKYEQKLKAIDDERKSMLANQKMLLDNAKSERDMLKLQLTIEKDEVQKKNIMKDIALKDEKINQIEKQILKTEAETRYIDDKRLHPEKYRSKGKSGSGKEKQKYYYVDKDFYLAEASSASEAKIKQGIADKERKDVIDKMPMDLRKMYKTDPVRAMRIYYGK